MVVLDIAIQAGSGFAQNTGTALTFIPGSSVKVEQVIGDLDYQTKGATASQSTTRFNVHGTDVGSSFEANGKIIFTFGDTISRDIAAVNYRAGDPIAWSTSTDPDAGLLLNFYTNTDGSPLFVKPSGVPMAAEDVHSWSNDFPATRRTFHRSHNSYSIQAGTGDSVTSYTIRRLNRTRPVMGLPGRRSATMTSTQHAAPHTRHF
jgi:hypothetical protein